jgi:hypothetical protein
VQQGLRSGFPDLALAATRVGPCSALLLSITMASRVAQPVPPRTVALGGGASAVWLLKLRALNVPHTNCSATTASGPRAPCQDDGSVADWEMTRGRPDASVWCVYSPAATQPRALKQSRHIQDDDTATITASAAKATH